VAAATAVEPLSLPLTVVAEVTEPVIAGPAQPADSRSAVQPRPPSQVAGLLGIACGLLVVAGSLGPWVTTRVGLGDPIAIHGSEGDGRFTVWCGIAAVIGLALLIAVPSRPGFGVAAAGAFFLAALIGIADWTNVNNRLDELARLGSASLLKAEIGWGLPAVTLGGLAGTVLAVAQVLQSRRAADEA
jgi:hypothetical protein